MPRKATQLPAKELYDALMANDVRYFCGVPDSLVSSYSFFVEANAKDRHTIAANEGNAVGLAIGYHVATGDVPLVYMQNSGLGNAVDPLVSLADPSVLSVPMILLISWRGQPGIKDEPQHAKQGAITEELLGSLGIPHDILSYDVSLMQQQVRRAVADAAHNQRPYALLVQKDLFEGYSFDAQPQPAPVLSREEAIRCIADNLDDGAIIVASIGKISRELFEHRETKQLPHDRDLLIVGGMGHASSIALGIAEQKPGRRVYCLDGDGSVLMHMGALATIGSKGPKNLYHIVLNNGVHGSVGGQPTVGRVVDIPAIATACNYAAVHTVNDIVGLKKAILDTQNTDGPVLVEVLVHSGARAELTRPHISPNSNKKSVSAFVNKQ